MVIRSSKQSRFTAGAARPMTADQSREVEQRFPHDQYLQPLNLPSPTFLDKAKSATRGLGKGVVYGGGAGLLASLMASPFYITAPVHPAVVAGWMTAVGAAIGGVGNSLVGATAPKSDKLRKEEEYSKLHDLAQAAELSADRSPTLKAWSEISYPSAMWNQLQDSDRAGVSDVLAAFKNRGKLVSGAEDKQFDLLRRHKLRVEGEAIDSLTELRFLDAASGGGYALLSGPEQAAVELFGGLAHRGFELGLLAEDGLAAIRMDPRKAASKVYENGFHGDERPFDQEVSLDHTGESRLRARSLAELALIDYVVGGGPEVAEAKFAVDALDWLRDQHLTLGDQTGNFGGRFLPFQAATSGDLVIQSGRLDTLTLPHHEFGDTVAALKRLGVKESFEAHSRVAATARILHQPVPDRLTRKLLRASKTQDQLALNTEHALNLLKDFGMANESYYERLTGELTG